MIVSTLSLRRRCGLAALFLLGTRLALGAEAKEGDWHSLFDGRTLAGWTIKIAGQPLGDNFRDTFRVEDETIKVSYDGYDRFERKFGHLYTNSAYSHYVLQLEYRITGDVMADAPSWTALNSGVMIHSQSPLSIELNQEWPVSVEAQFLALGTTAGRQTGNVCTPGTHIHVDGALTREHIIDARSTLPPRDVWIAVEVEVHGHDLVIHRINGTEVLRYTQPVLDESDPDAARLLRAGVSPQLGFGHIALQAEGQPVWFRNIRIRPLR